MPEGPEIRRAADQIAAALVGRVTTEVKFSFTHLQQFERYLTGHRVEQVESRGKAILTFFKNDWVIYSHNQLYGRWDFDQDGQAPVTNRQLRLVIRNKSRSAFLYSASDIAVMRMDELQQHPFLSRLGPDILNQRPSAKLIAERLRSRHFRNRQLGGLLLDQGFVAGLGNYLRAEILTLAHLHPLRRPSECSPRELLQLAKIIIKITQRSYQTGGIVNPPRIIRNLKTQGKTAREELRFNTYGREGEPCNYCGSDIQCMNTGGRKMYYCPTCQPES